MFLSAPQLKITLELYLIHGGKVGAMELPKGRAELPKLEPFRRSYARYTPSGGKSQPGSSFPIPSVPRSALCRAALSPYTEGVSGQLNSVDSSGHSEYIQ